MQHNSYASTCDVKLHWVIIRPKYTRNILQTCIDFNFSISSSQNMIFTFIVTHPWSCRVLSMTKKYRLSIQNPELIVEITWRGGPSELFSLGGKKALDPARIYFIFYIVCRELSFSSGLQRHIQLMTAHDKRRLYTFIIKLLINGVYDIIFMS